MSKGKHWNLFNKYKKNAKDLYDITEAALKQKVKEAKQKKETVIDSQILVHEVLTELARKHNFHRQFNTKFPNNPPTVILGMQLYEIIKSDVHKWEKVKSKKAGHKYSHFYYFLPA